MRGLRADADQHDYRKRHRFQDLPDREQHRVDRGIPARLQRHHPVDRGKGDRAAVQNQSRAAQETKTPVIKTAPILGHRPGVERKSDDHPDNEIPGGPAKEERHVEIPAFFKQLRLCAADPFVQQRRLAQQAQEQRQKKQRQQTQSPCAGFEDPSQHQSPNSPRQMLKHEQHQTPQGDP